MIELKLHKTIINSKHFGYWSNEIKNPRRVSLLMSPGPCSGKFFKNFEKYLNPKDLWICPDYPGRGYSLPQTDNSIDSISESVKLFLKDLGISNIYLIGFSYGTQIATLLTKKKDIEIEKIILVASGQYYNDFLRMILKTAFGLLCYSEKFMLVARNLINKISNIPNKNLKELNMQWLSTLKYEVPNDFITNIPTIFVDFNKDNCVVRKSRNTLRKIFVNHKSYLLDKKHPVKKIDFEEVFLKLWNIIYE